VWARFLASNWRYTLLHRWFPDKERKKEQRGKGWLCCFSTCPLDVRYEVAGCLLGSLSCRCAYAGASDVEAAVLCARSRFGIASFFYCSKSKEGTVLSLVWPFELVLLISANLTRVLSRCVRLGSEGRIGWIVLRDSAGRYCDFVAALLETVSHLQFRLALETQDKGACGLAFWCC
jgi:hypothetical protein